MGVSSLQPQRHYGGFGKFYSKTPERNLAPRFKFGLNPPLIDGILNVLPYELAHKTIMKSQKNGHGNAQIAKIFCDL